MALRRDRTGSSGRCAKSLETKYFVHAQDRRIALRAPLIGDCHELSRLDFTG